MLGKGRRERALPYGHKTAVALDRYLRVRLRHKDAHLPWLWLGNGAGSPRGAWSACSYAAGGRPACPACTRTSSATPSPTSGSPEGGAEVDLMRLAGWRSRADAWPLRRHGRRRPRPRGAPPAVARRPPVAGCVSWRQLEGIEGHRTVITMESSSACQEWSIPGPQTA